MAGIPFSKNHGRDNDPKDVFTVKDGMIRISGEEWGCITTLTEYENYHLVLEFRWGELTFEPRLGDLGIVVCCCILRVRMAAQMEHGSIPLSAR